MSEQPQQPQTDIGGWNEVAQLMHEWPEPLQRIAQEHLDRRGIEHGLAISPEHHAEHVGEVEAVSVDLITPGTSTALVDTMGAILEIGDELIHETMDHADRIPSKDLPVQQAEHTSKSNQVERLDDYETLNQQELNNALEEYTQFPGEDTTEPELQVGRAMDALLANHDMLEDVAGSNEAVNAKPAMTICVPVAILKEDSARITKLLEDIKAQQKYFSEPVEVILWTNAKFSPDTEASVKEEAAKAYEQLKDQIQCTVDGSIQIKSALKVSPEAEFSMSKVRSDYMEALAIHAKERGYGFDHAVMWLDADTTDIRYGTLKAVADDVKSFKTLFSQPTMYYSVDWADKPIAEMDNATRAFAVDEVARRMALRAGAPNGHYGGNEHGYFEESGCSFALGTYLRAGGVNRRDPINETMGLINRASQKREEQRKELRGLGGIIPKTLTSRQEVFSLGRQKITHRVTEARIYVSGRNHYEGLRETGVMAERRSDSSLSNESYRLFADVATTDVAADINIDNLKRRATTGASRGTNYDSEKIERLLDKYFNSQP